MSKKISVNLLLLCTVCLFVYTPVLFLDFQRGWDDGWMVMNHYTVFGFTWDNILAVFTQFHVAQYGPINELVYMAIHAVFGYNPALFHLYPLLLHVANSCLVFLFMVGAFPATMSVGASDGFHGCTTAFCKRFQT